METSLSFISALDVAHLIRDRLVSPVEITEAILERIEHLDSILNCFCFVYHEEAVLTK
jgi:Asp-tRNA(Asn)/Glu-tRNA(Gln) amidotransferase A subunit family amidase